MLTAQIMEYILHAQMILSLINMIETAHFNSNILFRVLIKNRFNQLLVGIATKYPTLSHNLGQILGQSWMVRKGFYWHSVELVLYRDLK